MEAELIAARASAAEQREQATRDLDAAIDVAARAGVGKRVELLASQLRESTLSAEVWRSLLDDLARDWRDVLHRHRELLGLAHAAAAEAERARGSERDAASQLEQIYTRREACEQELEQTRGALTDAFADWREGLLELELDEQAAADALALAHAGKPAASALSRCAERVRSALADERSALLSAQRSAADAAASAQEEIESLLAARNDGPGTPAWSRAERAERAGAPLWRLVDFKDELPTASRAGLEAALEASGLLDAWVTQSGRLEDPTARRCRARSRSVGGPGVAARRARAAVRPARL